MKLQDMKLQDMKLQDTKLQDMKMSDMKMQDMNMTNQKWRQGVKLLQKKSTILTEITLQLSNDEIQRSSLESSLKPMPLRPHYCSMPLFHTGVCSSRRITLIFDIFRIGVVTGYREGMLNLLNLFSLKRLPLLKFWASFISCSFMCCYFMSCISCFVICLLFSSPAISRPAN